MFARSSKENVEREAVDYLFNNIENVLLYQLYEYLDKLNDTQKDITKR